MSIKIEKTDKYFFVSVQQDIGGNSFKSIGGSGQSLFPCSRAIDFRIQRLKDLKKEIDNTIAELQEFKS